MRIGDRLRDFLASCDGHEVLLVAPFVKAAIFEALLDVVADGVPVRCVTRWRAEEVLAGVSDLEVADVAAARPNTRLLLLPDLHGKLYARGDLCLVGSANLTRAALGWSPRSNSELLVEINRSHPDVVAFERILFEAVPADASRRTDVAAAIEALKEANWTSATHTESADSGTNAIPLPRIGEDSPGAGGAGEPTVLPAGLRLGTWLPLCKTPQQLFDVYEGRIAALTMSALRDARSDLSVLRVPKGLNARGFVALVRSLLSQHPVVQTITETMTRCPIYGQDIVAELEPYTGETSPYLAPREAYEVLRSWMLYFFPDRYLVEKRFEGEEWSLGKIVAVWASR